jgi:hypothetical protein
VKRPGAPVFTKASWVIEDGNPIAQQVGGSSTADDKRASRAVAAEGGEARVRVPDEP